MRREFRNWSAAMQLLLWLCRHPDVQVFDLDCPVFTTRVYSGRQP